MKLLVNHESGRSYQELFMLKKKKENFYELYEIDLISTEYV